MYAEKYRYNWADQWFYVSGANYHDCRSEALRLYGHDIEPDDLQRWTGSRWEWLI